MKTFRELKSCLGILLLTAFAPVLPAQISGDPAASLEGEAAPQNPGDGFGPLQAFDPNLKDPDTVSPRGAPQAFLQAPARGKGTDSGNPPGAASLIRRQLRPGEPGPWTAAQVTGAPDTLTMGDYSTAWAAANADAGEEWLSVQFTLEADLDRVRVVQSYNPGAITKVTAERGDGQQIVLEEAKPTPGTGTPPSPEAVEKHARHRQHAGTADTPVIAPVVAEFVPPAGTSLRTTSVRITIDEPKVPGWNEIDAVEIVSRNGARQWAQAAKASSSFGDRVARGVPYGTTGAPGSSSFDEKIQRLEERLQSTFEPARVATGAENKGLPWSPEQATGEPDTPVAGDCPTAWAPLTYTGREWLDVTFAKPAELREVRIVESSETHAITGAQVYVNGSLVPLTIKCEEPVPMPAETVPVPRVPEPIIVPGDGSGPVPGESPQPARPPAPHIVSAWPTSADLAAVQKVRIELDATGLTTWPEIDAVEIVGTDGSRQWAARADASSTFAVRRSTSPYGYPRGYRRANTLEEANERIDILTRRLEKLEQELNRTKTAVPAASGSSPPQTGDPVPPVSGTGLRVR